MGSARNGLLLMVAAGAGGEASVLLHGGVPAGLHPSCGCGTHLINAQALRTVHSTRLRQRRMIDRIHFELVHQRTTRSSYVFRRLGEGLS